MRMLIAYTNNLRKNPHTENIFFMCYDLDNKTLFNWVGGEIYSDIENSEEGYRRYVSQNNGILLMINSDPDIDSILEAVYKEYPEFAL